MLGTTLAAVATLAGAAAAQAPIEARDASVTDSAVVARGPIQVHVLLAERTLLVLTGNDTLRTAPAAVASNAVLRYAGRVWRFSAPSGTRVVRDKREAPVWRPPDWHYAEAAREHGLKMQRLTRHGMQLSDGRRLVVRDSVVGIEDPLAAGEFFPLPIDEHIVFDSTLFIPPLETRNRQITGVLGGFALDLGDGFLIHGTNNPASIGSASTHGCIRLGQDDIEWLYQNVPIGAQVVVR